jgi:hypothetical protein
MSQYNVRLRCRRYEIEGQGATRQWGCLKFVFAKILNDFFRTHANNKMFNLIHASVIYDCILFYLSKYQKTFFTVAPCCIYCCAVLHSEDSLIIKNLQMQ